VCVCVCVCACACVRVCVCVCVCVCRTVYTSVQKIILLLVNTDTRNKEAEVIWLTYDMAILSR